MTVAARSGHRREALYPESSIPKAPRLSELGITTALVLTPASPGHSATSPALPSVPSLAEQAVLRLRPQRREEARK
jgi:hypothetical protein